MKPDRAILGVSSGFGFAAVIATLMLGACTMIGNRFEKQVPVESVTLSPVASELPVAPETLTITSWNIGYGGMGAESDFVFDGGSQRRPPNAGLVDKNITGIRGYLAQDNADILILQEVARPSWINYGRDLVEILGEIFPDRGMEFNADIVSRGIPRPFRVEVGNATVFDYNPSGYDLAALPLEPYFELGLFRKNYRMHVLRLRGESRWTIINIHLSAFDPEDIDVRRQQIDEVFRYAGTEYAQGRRVIIGGDWNLILSDAAYPHATPDKHSFWVRTFPKDALPDGWQIVADQHVPTVRLAHRPYTKTVNRTIGIDGFIVSPNVEVNSVTAADLGFEWSDHNPVTASFRSK